MQETLLALTVQSVSPWVKVVQVRHVRVTHTVVVLHSQTSLKPPFLSGFCLWPANQQKNTTDSLVVGSRLFALTYACRVCKNTYRLKSPEKYMEWG